MSSNLAKHEGNAVRIFTGWLAVGVGCLGKTVCLLALDACSHRNVGSANGSEVAIDETGAERRVSESCGDGEELYFGAIEKQRECESVIDIGAYVRIKEH